MSAGLLRLASLLWLPILAAASCQGRAGVPDWLHPARRCARAESDLHAGRIELSPALAEQEKCRKALSALPPPNPGELETVLRSSSGIDRLAALFVMSEKRLTDDRLVTLALSSYSPGDTVLVRLRSVEALTWMRQEQVERHSADLARALGREDNALVVTAAHGLLAKLDRAEVTKLAAGWIKSADFELQFAAFETARRLGLVGKLRAMLMDAREDGALGALDRLERMGANAADDRGRR